MAKLTIDSNNFILKIVAENKEESQIMKSFIVHTGPGVGKEVVIESRDDIDELHRYIIYT